MHRKKFIQNTGAILAGGMLARPGFAELLKADPVFGQNEKRYTLNRNWVQAQPADLPVNDCHEMLQDSRGHIVLLTNETKNNVIFFDKSGMPVNGWGHEFPGAHGFSKAGEGSDEHFYITDTERHQVFKTTPAGRIIRQWNYPAETGKYENAAAFVPTETAIAANGDMYVADGYGAQYIIHYDAAGTIKNIFGGRGPEPQHLDNAHGICIDERTAPATLLITDRTRCCFKRFSLNGDYMETITLPGACVCRPVIKGGYLYAAVLRSPSMNTDNSGFVIILNRENKVISVIGGAEPEYENGQPKPFYQTVQLFKHPHDVLVDDEDNLYVCQWNSGKAYPYKFTPVV